MADHLTKENRSRNMAKIKSKNTKPEMDVRKLLYSLGYRYRLHVKNMPGQPDIVLKKYRTVIFINGCFWHQHNNCGRSNIPKTNQDYWIKKINKNRERDTVNYIKLVEESWKIIVIWECEIKDIDNIIEKLQKIRS